MDAKDKLKQILENQIRTKVYEQDGVKVVGDSENVYISFPGGKFMAFELYEYPEASGIQLKEKDHDIFDLAEVGLLTEDEVEELREAKSKEEANKD